MKWRFALTFLAAFAFLVGVWWVGDVGERYRIAVLATVRYVSPFLNGWQLDYDQPGLIDSVVYHMGNRQLPMLLDLQQLSMGFLPFLSLVVATPGLGIRRIVQVAALGSAAYFFIHVGVVLVYPIILDQPNFLKDTIGVFSGLIAFVLAPLGLWFVLTYSTLRSLWQLTPNAH